MPNCTAQADLFPQLGRRKIDVRIDGGDVTSDGGLLLLRQVERKLGLLKAVADSGGRCAARSTQSLSRRTQHGADVAAARFRSVPRLRRPQRP